MPCYDRLTAAGAVWESVYGWEDALWYAPPGVEPKDTYSYRTFNYMPYVEQEVSAIRNGVALIEMTAMSKFEISGQGHLSFSGVGAIALARGALCGQLHAEAVVDDAEVEMDLGVVRRESDEIVIGLL